MENNEQLTSVQIRREDDMRSIVKVISGGKNKIDNLESQFAKLTRLLEQTQQEYENLNLVSFMVFLFYTSFQIDFGDLFNESLNHFFYKKNCS